mgnify:CR=1 FL=1
MAKVVIWRIRPFKATSVVSWFPSLIISMKLLFCPFCVCGRVDRNAYACPCEDNDEWIAKTRRVMWEILRLRWLGDSAPVAPG